MDGLIPGVEPREMAAMCLGLAHRWDLLENSLNYFYLINSYIAQFKVCYKYYLNPQESYEEGSNSILI